MATSWPMSPARQAERTQRLRRHWDKHARNYDRQMAFWERRLFGDGRQWVCQQTAGEVLEVAIGTGRNLPLYPPDVRLTGIDFSPRCCSTPSAAAIQWLLERVTIPLGGEHLRRRPLRQVQAQGFQVERRERSKLGIVERLVARKPA
jgi:hypothetical protein